VILSYSWVATISYMLLITVLSHIPAEDIPNLVSSGPNNVDLLFHFAEYSILGFLLFNSINTDGSLAVSPFYGSIFLGMFFSMFDEFHQSFVPGRHMSLIDIIFDLIGILFGTIMSSRIFNPS